MEKERVRFCTIINQQHATAANERPNEVDGIFQQHLTTALPSISHAPPRFMMYSYLSAYHMPRSCTQTSKRNHTRTQVYHHHRHRHPPHPHLHPHLHASTHPRTQLKVRVLKEMLAAKELELQREKENVNALRWELMMVQGMGECQHFVLRTS